MERKKITLPELQAMKGRGERITMVTAYDYPTALLCERAGLDMILVGDSLAMVVLGYESTVPVTMDEMLHHTRAVMRARPAAFVVADLPFLSYQVSVEAAILNAGRCLKEGGADAVKLEGGGAMVPVVEAIVAAGIPVMGHLGLTPQTASLLGGFRVQGKAAEAAERILADARALQAAGAFSLVLECVPASLGEAVSKELSIPVIGIGAGPDCDGQVLVYHDLLGLFDRFRPKFVKCYADLGGAAVAALQQYCAEVKSGAFPAAEHTFK